MGLLATEADEQIVANLERIDVRLGQLVELLAIQIRVEVDRQADTAIERGTVRQLEYWVNEVEQTVGSYEDRVADRASGMA
jgi:hypothetical protein